jgi:hypothetical protein
VRDAESPRAAIGDVLRQHDLRALADADELGFRAIER